MQQINKRSGTLFIISSPSGVGKTTIANFLVKEDKSIKRSISYTTRKPRCNEKNGVDYFFVTEKEFLDLVAKGKMLEYAKVFTDFYGTSSDYVKQNLDLGFDVLCCIDWQGVKQIKEKTDIVGVFLLPPSFSELERRLRARKTESDHAIQKRLDAAHQEIKQYIMYDYVIVNDSLDLAQNLVLSVIQTQRFSLKHNKTNIENTIATLNNRN